jgi:hypothetical protein
MEPVPRSIVEELHADVAVPSTVAGGPPRIEHFASKLMLVSDLD